MHGFVSLLVNLVLPNNQVQWEFSITMGLATVELKSEVQRSDTYGLVATVTKPSHNYLIVITCLKRLYG